MAACRSLQHIFEKPLPENQALLESVTSSWSQNVEPVEQSSIAVLFDELNFKDNSLPIPYNQYQLSSIDSSSQMSTNKNFSFSFPLGNKNDIGFSSVKSESLQLCTEGLGSESSDDVEDLHGEMTKENWQIKEEKLVGTSVKHSPSVRRSGMSREAFPPPLSFIGRSGKTGVFFKSYRQNGRFVLKQVRIPTQEFLQAHREDGRLKLQIVQPNDYLLEEEEDEDEANKELDDVEEENDVTSNGRS